MLEESGQRDSGSDTRYFNTIGGTTAISAAIADLLLQNGSGDGIAAWRAEPGVQLIADRGDERGMAREYGTVSKQEVEALIAPMVPDILDLVRHRLQNNSNVLPLTRKEFEMLSLLAKQLSNKQISRALNVEVCTVKWHLKNLFSKLNATSRAHAVDRARTLGIFHEHDGSPSNGM